MKDFDRRVGMARLTRADKAERAILDCRSDELAASFLEHLSEKQRARLVDAMAEVERLLTAATVTVSPVDPTHPHALHCLRECFCELDRRFDGGFDPTLSIPAEAEELRPPAGVLLVATLRSVPVGCGAVKFHENEPSEIKTHVGRRVSARAGPWPPPPERP